MYFSFSIEYSLFISVPGVVLNITQSPDYSTTPTTHGESMVHLLLKPKNNDCFFIFPPFLKSGALLEKKKIFVLHLNNI